MNRDGQTPDPALLALFDAAAEEERAVLAEALQLERAPGLERVEAFVREELEPTLARQTRTRRITALVAALAAGLALVFLFPRGTTSTPHTNPDLSPGAPLGALSLTDLRASEDFHFRWSRLEGAEVHYVVSVLDPARPDAPPLHVSPRLTAADWSPAPPTKASWPDSIQWKVSAYDASGAYLTHASADARRSSSD